MQRGESSPRRPLAGWGHVCASAAMVAIVLAGCGKEESSTPRPGGPAHGARPGAGGEARIPDLLPDDGEEVADADYGGDLFLFACATCHGTNGQGLPQQGADLRFSAFIKDHNDQGLVEYLQTGRAADDPANKLGVAMPARGNPQLTDDQLPHVVAFLRQLQAEAGPQGGEASAGPRGSTPTQGAEPSARLSP